MTTRISLKNECNGDGLCKTLGDHDGHDEDQMILFFYLTILRDFVDHAIEEY